MIFYNKISLVVATLGREHPLDVFLESISLQTYPKEKIEIIIVDQNRDIDITGIVNKYTNVLNVNHIKSNVLGLSVNRNIGIAACTGDIVAFPDDDCSYPVDTLSKVNAIMQHVNVDFILGRIWDNKLNKNAFRNWPRQNKVINKINFYRLTSSITLFSRDVEMTFDEDFGVGGKFGSNEDAAYVYSLLKANKKGAYNNDIVVFHEDQPVGEVSSAKVSVYSKGFGKFIRKYISFPIFCVFLMSIGFQFFALVLSLIKGDKKSVLNRYLSIKNRIIGFLL